MPTAQKEDFEPLFRRLKAILTKQRKGLKAGTAPGTYGLTTGPTEKYGKPIAFGSVKIGKAYVSYHLMAVYMYPDLAKQIPAELKKRMQGKSCFNFTRQDPGLFAALEDLTRKSRERFAKDGLA